MTNPKIFQRIVKLLALARDGGATEAEAALAMSKAQELMLEHNLSMATLEARGSQAEGRIKEENQTNLMYPWKRELLKAIAGVNFCYLNIRHKRTASGQHIGGGYEIIGRESNVAAVKNMFDYLLQTIERLIVVEVGTSPQERYTRWAHSFRLGCSQRLQERLTERHEQQLKDQERAAREANVRSSHPAAAPTGNALVVVMRDFAQVEEDLNADLRYNREPGTTTKLRIEAEAGHQQRQRELVDKAVRLRAEDPTISEELADYLARGWERSRAEEILGVNKKPETERQRQKREDADNRYWQRQQDKQNRIDRKTDWRAYDKGSKAANAVGFDQQVHGKGTGKIT